jgi:hypothetical protein
MLAYVLALIVGLGSFTLYMVAFFFPEVHRKNDFIWSGVGLFYALVLWVCAGRITGGLLLGEIAGVALMGWLGWQTFLLRRQVSDPNQLTPMPSREEVQAALSNLASPEGRSQLANQTSRTVGQVRQGIQGAISSLGQKRPTGPLEEPYAPPDLDQFGTAGEEAIARFAKVTLPKEDPIATTQAAIASATEAAAAASEDLSDTAQQAVDAVAEAASRLSTPTPTSAPSSDKPTNPVGSLFSGFGKKKENKPIYVRKQFRDQPATSAKDRVQLGDATLQPARTATTAADSAAAAATAASEAISESISETISAGMDAISAVTPTTSPDSALEAASEAIDSVTTTTSEIVADAKDTLHDVTESFTGAASETLADAKGTFQEMAESATDAFSDVSNQAASAANTLEDSGAPLIEEPVSESVNDWPPEAAIAPEHPNLLDNDRPDCTVEEIMEELLDEISIQEQEE